MNVPDMRSSPVVLYIDDNQNDRMLVQLAATLSRVDLEFRCMDDISEGIDYLTGRGGFADRQQHPLPAFILVDYHLRGCIGLELVVWLRAQPELAAIPVCVYSDADVSEPIGNSYRAGADHFLTKAQSLDRLQAIIKVLDSCVATAPPSLGMLKDLPEHRSVSSIA